MDGQLALLCLNVLLIYQMGVTVGAVGAVAEAHPEGADPVWAPCQHPYLITCIHIWILGVL